MIPSYPRDLFLFKSNITIKLIEHNKYDHKKDVNKQNPSQFEKPRSAKFNSSLTES